MGQRRLLDLHSLTPPTIPGSGRLDSACRVGSTQEGSSELCKAPCGVSVRAWPQDSVQVTSNLETTCSPSPSLKRTF